MLATASFSLDSSGVYRCCAFDEFRWQRHGFGTRNGSPAALVALRQNHSADVVNAQGLRDREQEGDALVTDDLGLSIGVRTADCVPILLLDPLRRAVAAIHAGWRGSAAGIVINTVRKMTTEFATDPADVYAAIGPCIQACCYQVGVQVAQRFTALFAEWEPVTEARNLDLAEANRRQLESVGLRTGRIFNAGLCTACESTLFYSYRREPTNPGRMVSAICRIA